MILQRTIVLHWFCSNPARHYAGIEHSVELSFIFTRQEQPLSLESFTSCAKIEVFIQLCSQTHGVVIPEEIPITLNQSQAEICIFKLFYNEKILFLFVTFNRDERWTGGQQRQPSCDWLMCANAEQFNHIYECWSNLEFIYERSGIIEERPRCLKM